MKKNRTVTVILTVLIGMLISCGNTKVEPIKLNVDKCSSCGMTITESKFAAELITSKGRIYKFDDMSCMIQFSNENKAKTTNSQYYISEFLGANQFISALEAYYISGEQIKSPMSGQIAAFSNIDSANFYAKKYNAQLTNWKTISQ